MLYFPAHITNRCTATTSRQLPSLMTLSIFSYSLDRVVELNNLQFTITVHIAANNMIGGSQGLVERPRQSLLMASKFFSLIRSILQTRTEVSVSQHLQNFLVFY